MGGGPTFHKYSPPPGSRPGTIVIPPGSPPPKICIMQYSPEGFDEMPVERPEDIQGHLAPDKTTWIDVQGLGDEATLRKLAELFELHPLALEAAVNIPQRATTELYKEHQVIVARVPQFPDGKPETPAQVCLILGRGFVLSFQERYLGLFDGVRERIRSGRGRPIWRMGADYLAYSLVDAVVDHYLPLAERLAADVEDLEEEISENPHPDVLADLHRIRRMLVVVRRVGWPQREAVNALARDPSPFITDEVRTFLRGTYAQIAQIMELVDSARDSSTGLSELYLSSVSHKTNEIMKVLTLMASIFIPLTFIAGIYGMNFENMPELSAQRGYFMVLTVMTVVAVGMVLYFRRRGWMGEGKRRPVQRDGED